MFINFLILRVPVTGSLFIYLLIKPAQASILVEDRKAENMTNFAIVDLSNLFHRSRFGSSVDSETKIGLALLIVFRSLRKIYRELDVNHIVFAVDYGSWRTKVYPAYKSKRRLDRAKATEEEQEENKLFFDALNNMIKYLDEHTNCTVLRSNGIEGDDFVARWVQRHPDDNHIIISADSDFVQLMAPNVKIYDAINQRMMAIDKITDMYGKQLEFSVSPKDGKIKIGKPKPDFVPEEDWWKKALFVKLIRGDVGDSVFSAFPGVRFESKTKGSINSAWIDRKNKNYDWNNLMMSDWNKLGSNGETKTVRVADEFKINESVIDLTKQPENIIKQMDDCISEAINRPMMSGIGPYFLRFCKIHDLPSLENEATEHVNYLNKHYKSEAKQ
jgi:5'-3' exonuclease, N-terminal resolvase-like domain